MAKKKNNRSTNTVNSPASAPSNIPKQPASKRSGSDTTNDSFIYKYSQLLIISGIALVTFLFYLVILDNKLTNWDDLGYIISNTLIRDSSWNGIKAIFSTDNPVMGNYHPLTIMLYAFEYHYKQLEPFIYHFDSLILHILTTRAVYFFARNLTRRTIAAVIAALLFGLHPMHVESVAWAAGRKDVLYGLFFILSCNTYVNYIREEGNKRTIWYISGLLLFALSLLAKSVAVTLPVTLFLIDHFEQRKWSWKLLLEKVPHFALALLFGLLSVEAQKKIGALGSLDVSFTPLEHIALGGYALCTYLWKAIVPMGLSNFYPYPLKENGSLPGIYFVYPAILAALLFVTWKYGRKNRVVIFGLGFFIVNIFLLLQFIPVGGAVISDRYGYVPYLGLFIIAGWLVSSYSEGNEKSTTGKLAIGISLCYCLALGFATNERNKDWRDSLSLWNDDREKHPDAPVAYFYLGQEYSNRYEAATEPKEKKNYLDSTLYNYVKAIEHKPDYLNAIICLGELQRSIGQIDEAKYNYNVALKINNKDENVYLGLGIVYSIQRKFDSAEYCFKTALRLKPIYAEAHSNYANFLDITGKIDSSLAQYAIAISQNPEATIPYMNRAKIFMRTGKFDEAIADQSKVIQIDKSNADAYYQRSRTYFLKGNKQLALQDVEKARSMGYAGIDPNYYNDLKK